MKYTEQFLHQLPDCSKTYGLFRKHVTILSAEEMVQGDNRQ